MHPDEARIPIEGLQIRCSVDKLSVLHGYEWGTDLKIALVSDGIRSLWCQNENLFGVIGGAAFEKTLKGLSICAYWPTALL